MPKIKMNDGVAETKARLATEFAEHALYLTYQEKLEICIACGVHESTFDRYKTEVKKISIASKLLAEMKKITADRMAAC